MRILLPTDAWFPQVNGVVRTLSTIVGELRAMGHEVNVVSPDRFLTVPAPGYPEVRLAVAPGRKLRRILDEWQPDAVHIPVEGPLGWAARAHCLRRGWPFTSSYHTRMGDYAHAKWKLPPGLGFAMQRRFHAKSTAFLVQTASLERELGARGFVNIRRWGRGVDLRLFRPYEGVDLGLPGPVFGYVGRVSTEKRLDDFLSMDLPGTKVVVGDGPQRALYERRYPDAVFLGYRTGEDLARAYAGLDVLVLPSRFETFGLVILEALACGTPVAAYPVHGPIDVIGGTDVGVLDEDLRAAALRALEIPRDRCRAFAETFSWRRSAEEFLSHLAPIRSPCPALTPGTVPSVPG
ncbi:MAG TPA: glycosyltransferase family 1 protein [Azospirillaceae bacterium]|nr:glycosyltransferase family 1 protein [Azospirillaceae bacterium]